MFMGRITQRLTASALSVVTATIMIFAVDKPFAPNYASYTQINTYSTCAVLTSSNGQVLVVGYNDDMESYLRHKHINNITAFVSATTSEEEGSLFSKKYNAGALCFSAPEKINLGDFAVQHLYQNEHLKAVYVEVDNIGIVMGLNYIGSNQVENIRNILSPLSPQILFESRENKNFLETYNYDYIVSNDKIAGVQNNFATKVNGTFTFYITNGIISDIRSEN